MPCSEPLVGRHATQVLFDAIERLDLNQTLLRDWCRTGLRNIMQFAAGVGPALGQSHIPRGTFEQAVVASIAVPLQGVAEALQDIVCMLAGSPWRVGKDKTGRVITAPWAIVTGKRSEVTCFCAVAPRCQNRCGCLVHEELG